MNSKQDSRRIVSRLRRSVLERIRFHGLTPVAREIPPLRGFQRKRLRRGISYIQMSKLQRLLAYLEEQSELYGTPFFRR